MTTINIIATERTMLAVNINTVLRANIIAKRTNSNVMGVVKAQMIDLLKTKLQCGVAHFIYLKKDGSMREAFGTTSTNIMKANISGNGISRDSVNTVCYWDCEKV